MAKRRTSRDPEIGRRIKLRRLELGVSQTALGSDLGVTFQQIQKYENGTNRVSAGRLQQVAAFLKVPITFFYNDLGASEGGSEVSRLLESAHALRLVKAFSKLRDTQLRRKA